MIVDTNATGIKKRTFTLTNPTNVFGTVYVDVMGTTVTITAWGLGNSVQSGYVTFSATSDTDSILPSSMGHAIGGALSTADHIPSSVGLIYWTGNASSKVIQAYFPEINVSYFGSFTYSLPEGGGHLRKKGVLSRFLKRGGA